MLDIKFIRDNRDKVKLGTKNKNGDPSKVDEVIALDEAYRKLLGQVEILRSERNKASKEDREKGKEIKAKLKEIEPQLKKVEDELATTMRHIPNMPFDEVPVGKDDSQNVVVRKWGEPKKFSFTPKDHVELGEKLGILNLETAGKVSGTRFGYLMGDLARMEMALVQFAFDVLTNEEVLTRLASGYNSKPFVPVIPPVMIKPEVYIRMARLDPGQEVERYYMPKDDIYLIGSAEHTLGPLHIDQTLEEPILPIRYVGFSTAFRREAGSYGKDTKGILRVHQFDKVEMETFTVEEDCVKEQDFLVAIQEYIMQALELPYQVVMVCTGDMGTPDARQIDVETWLPGQNRYRETHSADLVTDYQSRRLNIKVKRKNGQTQLVHMNDATAIAIGRTLIAIIENYQNEDGSITIPKVLQKYLGKEKILPKS